MLAASNKSTIDYGLISPETLYGPTTCPHHRSAGAACWSDYGDGHVTYCPCGRQKRPTGGGSEALGIGGNGGMETMADVVISPPDVAVPLPVYDVSEEQHIGGRGTGVSVYGVHSQTPTRHYNAAHPQQIDCL